MSEYKTLEGTILRSEKEQSSYFVTLGEACPATDLVRLAELRERFGVVDYVAPSDTVILDELTLRQNAVAEIKQIRGETHDKFTKRSSGVSVVYALNYEAAVRFQAADSTPLRTGMPAEQHLAAFGAEMYPPKTSAEFAAYIIAENLRLGPSDVEVEQLYIRAMYAAWIDPVDQLPAIVDGYRDFCAGVHGD